MKHSFVAFALFALCSFSVSSMACDCDKKAHGDAKKEAHSCAMHKDGKSCDKNGKGECGCKKGKHAKTEAKSDKSASSTEQEQ